MKKQAKLLGTLGVATALSFCAANFIKPVSAESGEVTLQVVVKAPVGASQLISPNDGVDYHTSKINIEVNYTEASTIHYQLTHTDENGVSRVYDIIRRVAPSGTLADGTDSWVLDLKDYGGFGRYTLTSNINGAASTTDSVSFTYSAMGVIEDEEEDKVVVDVDEGVDHVLVQIFDEDGKAALDQPLRLKPDADGKVSIDVYGLGLKKGSYTGVVTPYDKDDNILDGQISFHFTIEEGGEEGPETEVPFVPSTGTIIGDMNLSNSDFVAALLMIFVAVVLGGSIVIKKTYKTSRK